MPLQGSAGLRPFGHEHLRAGVPGESSHWSSLQTELHALLCQGKSNGGARVPGVLANSHFLGSRRGLLRKTTNGWCLTSGTEVMSK